MFYSVFSLLSSVFFQHILLQYSTMVNKKTNKKITQFKLELNMKNIFIIIMVAILLLIGGIWWSNSSQLNDSNIISTQGIHWHPQLAIYIDGKKQDIPANIGVGQTRFGQSRI